MNDPTYPQGGVLAAAEGNAATVAERCRLAGGLLRVTLGDLREELGYRRLGKYVLDEVADTLTEEGLGWFPAGRLSPRENGEPRKEQEVWVFLRDDGLRCQVIDAIQAPEGSDVPTVLNGLLADRPQDLSPERKLGLIREILGL
ncbi:hypothetical protein PUR61_05890 [Streptomyces sp. BE20]|uniref:hypothetical protein n=1 Tax=Streptomycetaceae TaxID=2062 RepID=UPI002E789668|nr:MULTISPECIES: hypothetical protein [unclassified Streptomyces]MED7949220.1 hypothetical protein [Streptomyces sp. BE303]MEE1821724.1 hypothetical protein [Streptomyces sp. BE20]